MKKIVKKVTGSAIAITTLLGVSALGLYGCGSTGASNVAAATTSTENEAEKAEGSDNTEAITIRLGLLTSHVLPVVAEHNGYFEEEGLDVELISFNAGAPEVEAYTAGELDVIQTGDLPFLNGVINGNDLQIIGTYSTSAEINGIVVGDNTGIESFEDLAGKKISVPFGSNIQALLYEFLEKGGLTPDDAEVFNLNCGDGLSSVVSGDIDAAVLWEPFLTTAASQDGVHLLADSSEIRTFVCPISSSTAFIEEHEEELHKLVNALDRAASWAKENDEEAATLAAEYFGSDNADAFLTSIRKNDNSVPLTEAKIRDLKLGAQKNYEYGIITEEIDLDAHIDERFVK